MPDTIAEQQVQQPAQPPVQTMGQRLQAILTSIHELKAQEFDEGTLPDAEMLSTAQHLHQIQSELADRDFRHQFIVAHTTERVVHQYYIDEQYKELEQLLAGEASANMFNQFLHVGSEIMLMKLILQVSRWQYDWNNINLISNNLHNLQFRLANFPDDINHFDLEIFIIQAWLLEEYALLELCVDNGMVVYSHVLINMYRMATGYGSVAQQAHADLLLQLAGYVPPVEPAQQPEPVATRDHPDDANAPTSEFATQSSGPNPTISLPPVEPLLNAVHKATHEPVVADESNSVDSNESAPDLAEQSSTPSPTIPVPQVEPLLSAVHKLTPEPVLPLSAAEVLQALPSINELSKTRQASTKREHNKFIEKSNIPLEVCVELLIDTTRPQYIQKAFLRKMLTFSPQELALANLDIINELIILPRGKTPGFFSKQEEDQKLKEALNSCLLAGITWLITHISALVKDNTDESLVLAELKNLYNGKTYPTLSRIITTIELQDGNTVLSIVEGKEEYWISVIEFLTDIIATYLRDNAGAGVNILQLTIAPSKMIIQLYNDSKFTRLKQIIEHRHALRLKLCGDTEPAIYVTNEFTAIHINNILAVHMESLANVADTDRYKDLRAMTKLDLFKKTMQRVPIIDLPSLQTVMAALMASKNRSDLVAGSVLRSLMDDVKRTIREYEIDINTNVDADAHTILITVIKLDLLPLLKYFFENFAIIVTKEMFVAALALNTDNADVLFYLQEQHSKQLAAEPGKYPSIYTWLEKIYGNILSTIITNPLCFKKALWLLAFRYPTNVMRIETKENLLHMVLGAIDTLGKENCLILINKMLDNEGHSVFLLDHKNNKGETALHKALAVNAVSIVRVLLIRGAKKDQPDHAGNTPMSIIKSRLDANGKAKNATDKALAYCLSVPMETQLMIFHRWAKSEDLDLASFKKFLKLDSEQAYNELLTPDQNGEIFFDVLLDNPAATEDLVLQVLHFMFADEAQTEIFSCLIEGMYVNFMDSAYMKVHAKYWMRVLDYLITRSSAVFGRTVVLQAILKTTISTGDLIFFKFICDKFDVAMDEDLLRWSYMQPVKSEDDLIIVRNLISLYKQQAVTTQPHLRPIRQIFCPKLGFLLTQAIFLAQCPQKTALLVQEGCTPSTFFKDGSNFIQQLFNRTSAGNGLKITYSITKVLLAEPSICADQLSYRNSSTAGLDALGYAVAINVPDDQLKDLTDLIDLLIEHGADLGKQELKMNNILHAAVAMSSIAVLTYVLDKIKTLPEGRETIIKLLKDPGSDNCTPLLLAERLVPTIAGKKSARTSLLLSYVIPVPQARSPIQTLVQV